MSFMQKPPSWSSEYQQWHTRAQPHSSPSTFTPTRADLAFAVLRSSRVEPDGFTLALFKGGGHGNIAVDAMGRVLILSSHDFGGLTSLTRRILDLPRTGASRNAWVLAHTRTGRPIDRIFIPVSVGGEGELSETSVQGYQKGLTELRRRVGDITELPDVLQEFSGLVLEARDGYDRENEDREVIRRVRTVLEKNY